MSGLDNFLDDLAKHIESTQKGHYVGDKDKIQVKDLIEAIGAGPGFYTGNIIKYIARYYNDGPTGNRVDLLKAGHYVKLLADLKGGR